MKLLKQMICLTLSIVMILSFSSIAFAAETITIDTVTIQRYEDEFGAVDDELVTVVVEFTITNASDQMTLLFTSENISEISEETAPKIIFMDQSVTPDETTYKFNVEKSRIKSATGLDDIDGCTLYVTLFPCHECTKLVIQSGIKEIVYMDDKYEGTESDQASKKMLDAAKITYRKVSKIALNIE